MLKVNTGTLLYETEHFPNVCASCVYKCQLFLKNCVPLNILLLHYPISNHLQVYFFSLHLT